jgi:hypothetical protein
MQPVESPRESGQAQAIATSDGVNVVFYTHGFVT